VFVRGVHALRGRGKGGEGGGWGREGEGGGRGQRRGGGAPHGVQRLHIEKRRLPDWRGHVRDARKEHG
jgi:hypothetical protein